MRDGNIKIIKIKVRIIKYDNKNPANFLEFLKN